jgi:hypothetical protein
MTEALRPIGRALPGRALLDMPDADVRLAVAVGARAAADVKRPYHLGVLLGVSAGAYAMSLAGVTFLQATSEAETAAVHAPAVAASSGWRPTTTASSRRSRASGAPGDDRRRLRSGGRRARRLWRRGSTSLTATVSDIEGQSLAPDPHRAARRTQGDGGVRADGRDDGASGG